MKEKNERPAPRPGESVTLLGFYRCAFCRRHDRAMSVYLRAGDTFPPCPYCRENASWEHQKPKETSIHRP